MRSTIGVVLDDPLGCGYTSVMAARFALSRTNGGF
jgi:hypothetical protein